MTLASTTSASTSTSPRALAPLIGRSLLGLVFLVFGLNGFLGFLQMPPPEGVALTFMGGLGASGYFFPLLKGTEVLVGLALLLGRFVPLALTVLAPITLNILAFHLFLAPDGLWKALVLVALQVGLAWSYRDAFRALLAPRAQPATGRASSR